MTPQERALARLRALADRIDPTLRAAYLRALQEIRADLNVAEVTRLLDQGRYAEAAQYVLDSPKAKSAFTRVNEAYERGILKGVQSEAAQIPSRIVVRAPTFSQPIIDAVRAWEDGAFRRIRADVQEGLREHVATELARGIGPRQVATALKQQIGSVGLTAYDEKIIASFRRQLEEGKVAEALGRKLRDKRYAITKDLTPQQIDTMVDAYRRKLIAFRAETFARTSAIQAANDSTLAAWEAGVEQGLYDRNDVRVFWIVADEGPPNGRTCPKCEPVPKLNPNGVVLGQMFQTPIGPHRGPVLHPACRCSLWVRFIRAGATIRQRPQPGTTRLILPKAGAF